MSLRVAVRPAPFGVVLFFALMPSIVPGIGAAVTTFAVPAPATPAAVPVGHLAVLALDAAFCAWLRRGRACQEQREEAHGFMTLRRCGAAPAVLCVSAVRERVRGARFVVRCPPFAWQTVVKRSAC